ncbi:MAG TPA: T9SS type A sorting domain-containing protein, partial [Bacteroidia bacterium]
TNRVVLNWAVKLSSTQRSIKWVELRQDQSSKVWSLYQEGIYTPDASNRWCGSIAMDCHGDIALCYAVTSSSVSPSLAYTGRVPGDPLGTMSLAETVVFAGTGSISGSNRFGDYSHTSLDPSDGTTFWHTGMYSKSGSATGIYSFQIDPSACVVGVKENSQDEIQFTTYQSGSNLNVNVTRLPSNDFLFVELFDVSGKKISSKKVNPVNNAFETTVNVDGLSSGVYFVRIGAGDCQRVKKVVLQ